MFIFFKHYNINLKTDDKLKEVPCKVLGHRKLPEPLHCTERLYKYLELYMRDEHHPSKVWQLVVESAV